MKQELNLDGCIRVVGQVVKVAIQDASSAVPGFTREDARQFLFDGKRLEQFFHKYHMTEFINCEYIRQEARKIIEGEKTFDHFNVVERQEVEA